MNQPYQRQPMDRTAHRGRMVALMTRGGDIAAQGALRQGDISGRLWSDLADTTASAVASGVQPFTPEGALRRRELAEREATIGDRERARSRATNLDGLMQMVGDLPPDEAADVLDREGYRDEAAKIRAETRARREMIREDQVATWQAAQRHMQDAATLLDSVGQLATPEAQQAQYAAILPKVRELLGPEGASQLGITDTYDPQVVQGAATWGMTAAQRIQHRRQVWQEAQADERDAQQRRQWGIGFLAQLQADVDTQDEWEANNQLAKAMGVPDDVIDIAGPELTPEAQARLAKFEPKKAAEKVGDFEALVRQEAARKGSPLSTNETLALRRRWESAGWKPDAPKTTEDATAATPADLAQARTDVEASYQRQIAPVNGEPPSQAQIGAAERWRAGAMASIAELERKARRGGGMSGLAGGSAAPTQKPVQFVVPATVRKAMVNGPGDYAFSDGSVWRMQRDGRIVRVK